MMMMTSKCWIMITVLVTALLNGASAEQCGIQASGALCPGGLCCGRYGWCGTTEDYCGRGCQSNCPPSPPPPPSSGGITDQITESTFNLLLPHRSDCGSDNFYTYAAFVSAARSFTGFGTTGDDVTRKREIAAFLGQTSHETTNGAVTDYTRGYCYVKEQGNPPDYCEPNADWPCAAGKKYYGRGPIQISYNYNYGPAGDNMELNLLNDPDLAENDPIVSFRTAIWFWMTEQSNKPSCHDVMIGAWTPSDADKNANRVPGYGVVTNIINGGLECGHGEDPRVQNRIGFYGHYCDIMGVSPGDNLDCANQRSFASGVLVADI